MIKRIASFLQGFYFEESYWNNINELTKKEYKKYIKILEEEFIE